MFENLKLLQRMILFLLVPTIIIFGAFVIVGGYGTFNTSLVVLSEHVQSENTNKAQAVASDIETFLETIATIPKTLAHSETIKGYENGVVSNLTMIDEFSSVLAGNEQVLNVYFASNAGWDLHVVSRDDSGKVVDISDSFDSSYNYFDDDWFALPASTKTFQFSPPYFDEGGMNAVMVSAVAPVKSGSTVLGVVGCDLLISTLTDEVNRVNVGENGYAFLLSADGTVLTHPEEAYQFDIHYDDPKSISDWATAVESDDLSAIGQEMIGGKAGHGSFEGQTLYYQPINVADWSVGLVYPESETPASLFGVIMITFAMAVLGTAVLGVVVFFFARSLSKPITIMAGASEKLSQNDLTVTLDFASDSRQDEIGQLGRSFTQTVVNLRNALHQINSVAANLSSAAEEMAGSSEEVNASSEEISSITQQLSKGAQEQSNLVGHASSNVDKLQTSFLEKINGIQATSRVIGGIADQVNMLALNASIEAARAGEYGRGFAVVADNIRQLADDAKTSLASVNGTIKDLVDTLKASIGEVSQSIVQVSSVSEEAAAGAEEASAATEEQTATMEEMTATAQELASLAGDLEKLVKEFKL